MRRITIHRGILAVLCFFCIGCIFHRQAAKSSGAVGFISTGVTDLELTAMIEKEAGEEAKPIPLMAAYISSGTGKVENQQSSVMAEALVYEVWGHMGEAFDRPLSDGTYGFFNQNEGMCIISLGLARVLFQSENVVGLTLLYQGREWTIQGVMDLDRALILIPGGEGARYRRINLNYQDEKEGRSLGEAMLTRHNIGYQDLVVDYGFFTSFLHLLQTAVIWVFAVIISLAFYRNIQAPFIKTAAAFFISLLLLVLGGKAFTFSASLIPGMWSDFDFWTKRFQEIKSLLAGIEEMEKSVRDIDFFRMVKLSSFAYLAALGSLICQGRFLWGRLSRCFCAGKLSLLSLIKGYIKQSEDKDCKS